MRISLLLSLLFISAFSYSQNANQSGFKDINELRTVIQTQNLKFAEGVTKKDASVFMDLYLDNVRLMVPGEDFISGNDKVRSWWETYLKGDIHSMTLNTVSLGGDGDVLYETGQIIREIWKDNKASMQYDKYLTVWRLQDDGSYKIAASMWNPDKKMDW